jgi:hypothetical protein
VGRFGRFVLRAAILAALWWIPWTFLFARRLCPFAPTNHLWIGVAIGVCIGVVTSIVAKRASKEHDFLWLLRSRPKHAPAEIAAGVDARVACPWCGACAISRRKKLALGPAAAVPCASCAKLVSVSAKPLVVLLAMSSPAAALLTRHPELALATLTAGVVAAFVVHDRMKLVRR